MQVIVSGLMTTYDDQGAGKAVVCIHGWGDNSSTFHKLTAGLNNFRVICVDLPGFGKTETPKQVWGLDEYAQFIRDFLLKVNSEVVYAFVGHSNGGAILLRGLSKHDLKSQKLILLASSGIRSEYKGRKKFLRYSAKGMKVITLILPKQSQKRLKKYAYRKIGSDLFVAENLQETFKKVVGDDVRDDAIKITCPTLLIYGENDTATPVRYGQIFNDKIAHSQLRIVSGAGHFVHHDKPKEVLRYVQEFLA